jgi:hypothetical protein
MYRRIILVSLVLGINLIATMIYLFFLSNEERKKWFLSMPVLLQKSLVLLFVGPLFISPFLGQPRINILDYDWLKILLGFSLIFGGLIIMALR